jgi:hypothetical protein
MYLNEEEQRVRRSLRLRLTELAPIVRLLRWQHPSGRLHRHASKLRE